MKMAEYLEVKDLTYSEYCDYLQKKYGIGSADYMTASFNPNPKCSRTKEGLFAHHKKEDTMISLSKKVIAMHYPFEWQKKENIVYCDYLEHLLLHVLICKYPSKDQELSVQVGLGGVINFSVPELNDLYSGWQAKPEWRSRCFDLVKNDKAVYLKILGQFIENEKDNARFSVLRLCTSFNKDYGNWSDEQNVKIYREIIRLAKP